MKRLTIFTITFLLGALWNYAVPPAAFAQAGVERARLEGHLCEEERAAARMSRTVGGEFSTFGQALGGTGGTSRLNSILGSPFDGRDIMSYADGLELASGYGKGILEVHHLVEQRHIKTLGRLLGWSSSQLSAEIRNAPAVILTMGEHKCISKDLVNRLTTKDAMEYDRATILEAYRKAYAHEPNWVKAVTDYLTSKWPETVGKIPW